MQWAPGTKRLARWASLGSVLIMPRDLGPDRRDCARLVPLAVRSCLPTYEGRCARRIDSRATVLDSRFCDGYGATLHAELRPTIRCSRLRDPEY